MCFTDDDSGVCFTDDDDDVCLTDDDGMLYLQVWWRRTKKAGW